MLEPWQDNKTSNLIPKQDNVTTLGFSRMSNLDIEKLNAAYGCDDHNGDSCTRHSSGPTGMMFASSKDNGCEIVISVPEGLAIELHFGEFMVQR